MKTVYTMLRHKINKHWKNVHGREKNKCQCSEAKLMRVYIHISKEIWAYLLDQIKTKRDPSPWIGILKINQFRTKGIQIKPFFPHVRKLSKKRKMKIIPNKKYKERHSVRIMFGLWTIVSCVNYCSHPHPWVISFGIAKKKTGSDVMFSGNGKTNRAVKKERYFSWVT